MITESWNSCQIFDRPRNGWENCSSVFGTSTYARLWSKVVLFWRPIFSGVYSFQIIWNPSQHGSRHRPGQWLNRTWVLQSLSWTTSVPPELCSRRDSNPLMAQAISDVVGWCLERLCIDWIVFLCPVVSELEEGCVNAQAAFAFQIKKIPPYYNCGCAMSDVW